MTSYIHWYPITSNASDVQMTSNMTGRNESSQRSIGQHCQCVTWQSSGHYLSQICFAPFRLKSFFLGIGHQKITHRTFGLLFSHISFIILLYIFLIFQNRFHFFPPPPLFSYLLSFLLIISYLSFYKYFIFSSPFPPSLHFISLNFLFSYHIIPPKRNSPLHQHHVQMGIIHNQRGAFRLPRGVNLFCRLNRWIFEIT